MRRTDRALSALIILGAALVSLFYLNRVLTPWPLYAGDEGAYLIRALHGDLLAAQPERHPTLHPVGNTLFVAVIGLVDLLSANLLPWLRLLGLAAYLGALFLLHRVLRSTQARDVAAWGLLAALAYPFHRFVVTAMPEGLFVLGLAIIVGVSAGWALARPWAHAALVGALTAALVLIKPHGVVIIPAMAVLFTGLVALRQRRIPHALGQGALFCAAFMLTGAAIQWLAGREDAALTFFLGSAYADHFGRTPPAPLHTALVTMLSLGSATLLLTGAPLLAGGRALAHRWRRRQAPAPDEIAVLVLSTALLATLAMIVLFAVKVSAIPGESGRLWGRYFEFYTPLLWIAAAGPLCALWRDGGRPARLTLAALPVLGLTGLVLSWKLGVTLLPWDSAALSAFYIPHLQTWSFPPALPYFWMAAGVVAALVLALALSLDRTPLRPWAAALVALGLISTHYDHSWVSTGVAAHREALSRDLPVALALAPEDGLPTVVAYDHNLAHTAFLAYQGRAQILMRPPGPVPAEVLGEVGQVVVLGGPALPAPWMPVFEGEALTLYAREGSPP